MMEVCATCFTVPELDGGGTPPHECEHPEWCACRAILGGLPFGAPAQSSHTSVGVTMQTSTHTHTPGPWEVYEGHDGHFGKMREAYITHDSGTGTARITIARMIDCGYDNAADARLIAAAPALLDALAALVDVQDKREAGDISWDFAWADARAAIAAATGEDV